MKDKEYNEASHVLAGMKRHKRFYWLTLAVLLALSAYPLINGVRMVYLSIMNGAIGPEQYAKYVIPYSAMCTAVILFAAFEPLLRKIKRTPFLVGLAGAYAVFAAIEQFLERIQINTAGMTLVDPASLTIDSTTAIPSTAVDAWQASLCVISPLMRGQSAAFSSQGRSFYVMAGNAYKIHYYLISVILITMVCGFVYGIGRMIRMGTGEGRKPLILQGIATAALISLCVFANTSAFFRQAEAIQTPLASILTCLFFISLGVSVGVYTGSFILKKSKRLGLGLPVLLSVTAVLLMYIGETVMMKGGLYRFGTGWLFDGLAGIVLAPVDILVVLISAVVTLLILNMARKNDNWPDKRTIAIAGVLCILIFSSGIAVSIPQTKSDDSSIIGAYEFDDCLYMNPLCSFMPIKGHMPYVYYLGEDGLTVLNIETGDIQRAWAQYEKTLLDENDFSSLGRFSGFPLPDVTRYKDRWMRGVIKTDGGQKYNLYQMDGEIWLVQRTDEWIWSIYRLKRTKKYDLSDIEHALAVQNNSNNDKTRMRLRDVYELARKGKNLTLDDLDEFSGKAAGSRFSIMRYDIEGGCVLIVHSDTPGSQINYARLSKQGYDPFDESLTVDIQDGEQAVAAYLDPLNSLAKLKIEDPHHGAAGRELIYEFDGYRYFLNTTRADQIYITFDNGERLPLKQALEERRTIVEDLVANGLYNIFMEPVENPMGGYFTRLHHMHKFSFDDEAFYPSSSFMYIVGTDLSVYYNIAELADILELQGRDELAGKLRSVEITDNLPVMAGKAYIDDAGLADAGITVEIGWHLSSHTPINFTTMNN